MIRVDGLYLTFRNSKKVLRVEFVDFSAHDTNKRLGVWDKDQAVVYYTIESGQLSGYVLDGKNGIKLTDKQPKRWWQVWRR